MAKKYVFGLDSNGKVLIGTILNYPDEYTVEGNEDVWNNQERAFYHADTGTWTIYDRLTVSGPSLAVINETVNVKAMLPADSPDTKVTFQVQFGTEVSAPVIVPVSNGVAEQEFLFDVEGTYNIIASSMHHGSANMEVFVSVGNSY